MLQLAGDIASQGRYLDRDVIKQLYEYVKLCLRWAAIRQTYLHALGLEETAKLPGRDKMQHPQLHVVLEFQAAAESEVLQQECESTRKKGVYPMV